MKTSIKSLFALIAGVSLFAACEKQDVKEQPSLVNITITASQDTDTKTVLGENGQVNWSLSGEKLAVWQNGTYAKSEDGVTSDGGATMKFGVTLPSGTAPYSYYAVYPNMAAYKPGESSGSSASAAKIDLRQAQYPTSESFGPSSDILVAKPVIGLSEQPSELSLQFARMVAVGKMQIKNLNSTENVTRVTFKADGKKIAGRNTMDLTKDITIAEVSGDINPAQDNVALAYNGENIAANGMTAYFTCWPFSMTAGETFTVEVYTPSKYFTRTVTLPSDIEFKQGRATSFGVNFSGIEGVERQHFNYAKLTFDDFTKAGAKTEYSLTTVKPNGSDGPIWDCLAYKGTGIQLRDFSTVNDSYIKLPTFKDDIRTVIVTTTNGNRTICLENSAAGITKNISLTSVSGANTFDLTGKGMKTAYLRVSGGALQVSSIEVWAGEDTRTQLAAPANIMAALVDGTPNSIEVVWDAVENAGSYVVAATPENGDAVSETVTEASHTFTNLAYETEYTISVVAKPADTATHTDSEAGVCADKVTTGSKPAGGDSVNAKLIFGKDNTNINASTVTATDSENNSWTITTVGTTSFTPNAAYSQVGSSSKPATSITMVGTIPSGSTVTALSVKFGGFSGTAGNVSVKVGETEIATGALNATNDVTVSSTKPAAGDIVTISVTNIAKGVKIYEIDYTYDSVPDTRETLAKPENLICSAQTDNSLTFTWNGVADASGYQVSLDGGSNWETTQTETTYTWEGLSTGTAYTLYVKAIGDGVNFKDSDAVSAKGITTGEPSVVGEDVTVTISYNDIPDGFTATTGTSGNFSKAFKESALTISYSGINTKSSASAADHAYGYAMFLKNYGYIYSSSVPEGFYVKKVIVTYGSNTGTSGKAGIIFGKSPLTTRDSSVAGAVSKGGSLSSDNTDKTNTYWNVSTTGANVQIDNIQIVYSNN